MAEAETDTEFASEPEGEAEPELSAEEEAALERDRERERRAHHAMAMRLVRQYPDPALRVPATAIADVDDDVRSLVERMADIMRRSHGVGLAAPQIGVLRRVFVYRTGAGEPVRVLINPELGETSDEVESDTEGCLSLLGGEVTVSVERHTRIVARGLDESGAPVQVEAEGLEARVIQHELDHLDGVLIIDRAPKEDRRAALKELRLKA
ncbi:MAG TPA: peptide deformylase [Gaiellales bacterium]|jgi:peptide deformylase